MKQKKDIRITFRISDEELNMIDEIAKSRSCTRSEVIRQLSIENLSKFMGRISKENKNTDKTMFYFEKTSNHLNQVAKKLNTAHLKGEVNERTCISCLNMLSKINDSFRYGLYLCEHKK